MCTQLLGSPHGGYDGAMLTELSEDDVNEGLQNRTAIGAGSTKSVAGIDVGGREYAAARMQGALSEDTIRDEAAMIQILGMLGVRVPQLYGVRGGEGQKQLPRDDGGKLNMIMTKVNSSHPPYQIYDMPVNTLAPKLEEFLNAHHGNNAQHFRLLQTNMLGDLIRLRDVYGVLAIADLQVLIDDNTGDVTTFDPGAVVPRGHAGDQTKENNTRQNLAHACQRIAAFTFRPQASGGYAITTREAAFISECISARDLILRINKVLKKQEISNIKDASVTEHDIREVIRVNADKADLGELVEEKLEEAIALLKGAD